MVKLYFNLERIIKMNKYYVYCHCFSDTNEIFYIGKGCGSRLKSNDRSKSWKIVKGDRPHYAMKIKEFTEESDALDFEHELISEFLPRGNITVTKSRIKIIDFNTINQIVAYDETSPTFLRWKIPRANNAYKAGDIAGSFDSDGYGQIYIIDKLYKSHRIIYCLSSGEDLDSNLVVDHLDRNKSNNNINNLRLTTINENAKNINWKLAKPTNTGERAISLKLQAYRVLWTVNGKQKEKQFSFGIRSSISKDQALLNAITFRDTLISDGLIIQ